MTMKSFISENLPLSSLLWDLLPFSHAFVFPSFLLSLSSSAMTIMSSILISNNTETLQFQTLNFKFKAKRGSSNATNSVNLRISDCLNSRPPIPSSRQGAVSLRLRRLVSEFRSLPDPMDRVKKLLDHARVLPRLSESTRSPENRVAGCAAQVWLEVDMDEFRRMRFGADSGSEIIKGFSSCLVFLLQGASPQQVLMVKTEDLVDMNIGLPVRSRVNSWHNLLINMQERTRSLMLERGGQFLH